MILTLIFGVVTGSLYGLTSMGLVLTYRTSGVFNLAHGAVGMTGTYVFFWLWVERDVPMIAALVLVVCGYAPLLGLALYALVFRRIHGRSVATTLAASVVVLLSFQGLVLAIYGANERIMPSLFPTGGPVVSGTIVTYQQIGTGVVAVLLAAALLAYLQFTRYGLRTRAVVDNAELATLSGEPAQRIEASSWMLGTAISCLAGILISQFISITVAGLTLVVIQAMAAAVIGGLQSLPLTWAGGIGLGLLEKLLAKYLPQSDVAQGFRLSVSFVVLYAAVLIGALVFRRFADGMASAEGSAGGVLGRDVDRSRLAPLLLIFGAMAVWFPMASPYMRFLIMAGLAVSVALQGFVLMTGLSGQISLCQAALVGIGAVMFGRATTDWGWPLLAAAALSVAVAMIVGLGVSIPAVRVSGVPLALLTLALGLFMDNFLFKVELFSGGFGGFTVQRFSAFGVDLTSDYRYGLFVLAVAFLAALAVRNIGVGRTGRVLVALKNAETAAEAFGTSARRTKIALFSLSSAFAGLAGVLLAMLLQTVSATDYSLALSITYLAVALLGGVGSPQGAVVGGLLLYLGPELISNVGLGDYYLAVFGVGACLIVMARRGGVADMLSRGILASVASPAGDERGAGSVGTVPRPRSSAEPVGARRSSGDVRPGRKRTNVAGVG